MQLFRDKTNALQTHDDTRVTRRDHDLARRLPDELLTTTGPPVDRVTLLVERYYMAHPPAARRQLAQVLLAVLDSLLKPGALITDYVRQACEAAVVSWISRR